MAENIPINMESNQIRMIPVGKGLTKDHRHGGGSEDGRKIPDRNIDLIYSEQWIAPSMFETSNANVAFTLSSAFAALVYTDAVTGVATANILPPKYKKQISRIRIVYHNLTVSGNVRLGFTFTRGRIGKAIATSSLALAEYASYATINQMATIEIPQSAYSPLHILAEDDVLALEIERDGGNALDTYNNDFEILGLIVDYLQ